MRLTKRHNRGFTLIELLVVIAIIVILAAIMFPVIERAQMKGKQMSCLANLKQLGTAALMYAEDNRGRLPGQRPAFFSAIMSHVKEHKVFRCPSAEYANTMNDGYIENMGYPDGFRSNYGMNAHLFSASDANIGVNPDILPSPTEMPLFGDIVHDGHEWWFSEGDRDRIDRRHSEGANFCFCDGHAKMLKDRQIVTLAFRQDAP